jgi:exopolysaccharide biosynthesis WecB/TagA/CpsF family protein
MIDLGRFRLLGVPIAAVDYERAVERIVECAQRRAPLAVSALAVHGVMTGALDPVHARRLAELDLVVPDGQPVRWALRFLYGVRLADRVYGPELLLRALEALAARGLPVFLYGSTQPTLDALAARLRARIPELRIAGSEPSRFRRLAADEAEAVAARIERSGARAVCVGLGCPRQEIWIYEHRARLSLPLLAVGAAFAFHAGELPQAPPALQRAGLEWLFRLACEPRRLWRRYLLLNPLFLAGVALQRAGVDAFARRAPLAAVPLERFG